MNILFYVEPYPIRNTKTHFKTIACKALRMYVQGRKEGIFGPKATSFKVFSNRATLLSAFGFLPKFFPAVLWPTLQEERLFKASLQSWNTHGLTTWTTLLKGEGPAQDYSDMLHSLQARAPFDVLVYWGSNGAVKTFGAQSGIPVISMELGCSRAPYFESVAIDPQGANGDALPAQLPITDVQQLNDSLPPLNTLPTVLDPPPCPAWMQAQFQAAHLRGKKIAYIPLQLFDDANLLRFSPYKTPLEFAQHILPQLQRANWFSVFRPHPMSNRRSGALQASQNVQEYVANHANDTLWLTDLTQPGTVLFPHVDGVVTVNSSVGFEALYHNLPVCLMGKALYKGRGIFPDLSEFLDQSFDQETYQRHITDLKAFIAGKYLHPASKAFKPRYFCAQIQAAAQSQAQGTSYAANQIAALLQARYKQQTKL